MGWMFWLLVVGIPVVIAIIVVISKDIRYNTNPTNPYEYDPTQCYIHKDNGYNCYEEGDFDEYKGK